MSIFSNSPIKDRVMKVIAKKLEDADKKYVVDCETIDKEAEVAKSSLADKMVKDILGKII